MADNADDPPTDQNPQDADQEPAAQSPAPPTAGTPAPDPEADVVAEADAGEAVEANADAEVAPGPESPAAAASPAPAPAPEPEAEAEVPAPDVEAAEGAEAAEQGEEEAGAPEEPAAAEEVPYVDPVPAEEVPVPEEPLAPEESDLFVEDQYAAAGQPTDAELLAMEQHEAAAMYDPNDDLLGDDIDDEEEGADGGDYSDEDGDENLGDGDDESELVVLDPDHPLMKRFQDALTKMLKDQHERLEIERRECSEDFRKHKNLHIERGNELYNVQQELAKQQMILERSHDQVANTRKERQQAEMDLDDTRRLYKEVVSQFNAAKKTVSELQVESDNLALRLFYMRNAKEDVRGDIAVMRRAAEKADVDLSDLESNKMKQDILVDRMVDQVDRLREANAMCDAQISAQKEETLSVAEALTEAQMEVTAIQMEKKQLMSQWHSSLIGLQRRNEAQASMNEALRDKQERLLSLETEIDGYKKSIQQEQEKNEKLMGILMRTEKDMMTARKQLTRVQSEHESLKAEYAARTRLLQETENACSMANTHKLKLMNENEAIRKNIEGEFQARNQIEDDIMEQQRARLTMKKAAEYTKKLTKRMRDRSRDLHSQLAIVENNISGTALEAAYTESRISSLRKVMVEVEEEIRAKNDIITNLQHEIHRNNVKIEGKQGDIDALNKKLEAMITSAGGVELGPLEININHLTKLLNGLQEEIGNMEQMWLRDQQELVRLLNEKDGQAESVSRLKKQLTILMQKRIRIEGQIEAECREKSETERNLRHLQNDMVKLNGLIFHEQDSMDKLDRDNLLRESDYMRALKEDDHKRLEMKETIKEAKEEKEKLQNSLIEAEREIMLWQKKIQLAEETRKAVDSDVGQGEIRAMKAEIHRMQVRNTQLERQKEQLVQESVKAVSRRETIITRGEAQAKSKKKVLTRGVMQRQLEEIKKKIKQTLQLAADADDDIKNASAAQRELNTAIDDTQAKVGELNSHVETMSDEIQAMIENRQAQILELQQRQQTGKYYQQLKDHKYSRLCKTDATLEVERDRQVTRTQALHIITDRLTREYPQTQRDLRIIRRMLDARVAFDDSAR